MKRTMLLLMIVATATSLAWADTATVRPTYDIGVLSDNTTSSGNVYSTGHVGSAISTVYYQFNLSSLCPAGRALHINASEWHYYFNDSYAPDAVFQDGLYLVPSNAWTAGTISYDNAPVRTALLCSWDFQANYFGVATGSALTNAVQAAADNATDKRISFNVAGISPTADGRHDYVTQYGWGGSYVSVLYVDYTITMPDTLTISPNGGSFTELQTVTISGAGTGATVHYTLNGGDPTESDPVYSAPLTVSQTLTLKARAFRSGVASSDVVRADFSLPFTGNYQVTVRPTYDLGVRDDNTTADGQTFRTGHVGGSGTAIGTVYYQFDLAGIPTAATITGVEWAYYLNDAHGGDTAFQDGLYAVPGNDWTAATISYDNAPAHADLLCTWDFQADHFGVAAGPALTGLVQAVVDNATDKRISFNVAGINITADGWHEYVDQLAWGGSYVSVLRVHYNLTQVDNVTISPNGGTFTTRPQTVMLSCTTTGAVIHYTTDGTDPTSSSPTYSGSLSVGTTTIIKAIAYKDGYAPSRTAKALFTLPTAGTLVSSIAAADASASYPTDLGSDPVLWLGNFSHSDVKTYVRFNVPDLAKPPSGRTIINSAIFTWYGGGVDGTNPPIDALPPATLYQVWDNSWDEYNITYSTAPAFGAPIEIWAYPGNYQPIRYSIKDYVQAIVDNGSTTIGLGADAPNTWFSEVQPNRFRMFSRETSGYEPRLVVDYTIDAPRVATPEISPAGGTFDDGVNVSITCAASGAVIRYTLDGTVPDNTSALYTGPFAVSPGSGVLTLKAIAYAPAGSTLYKSLIATAVFDTPNDPKIGVVMSSTIPYGTASVDGDLSDWSTATWIPLNTVYNGSPSDITEAYYAARWTPSKIYVAIKVRDTIHSFTDNYSNWNDHDGLELYLHTNGYSFDTGYPNQEPAQQYAIGIKNSNRSAVWTDIGYKLAVPSVCNFQAAGKEGTDGQWLYYEAALTPFQYMGGLVPPADSVASSLISGQYVGFDVVAVGNNGVSYTGMKSENDAIDKASNYSQFGLHQLTGTVPAPGDVNGDGHVNAADLAIVLAAMDSKPPSDPRADIDLDGEVTSADLSIVLANME